MLAMAVSGWISCRLWCLPAQWTGLFSELRVGEAERSVPFTLVLDNMNPTRRVLAFSVSSILVFAVV